MHPSLPVDPQFPTMNLVLDPAHMATLFTRSLARVGFAVTALDCAIERMRHKSGRKLLIGYRLQGRDGNGKAIDQRVMVSMWPNGDAAALPAIGRTAPMSTPLFGPPSLVLDDIGGSAWFFPNDRKLHHIAALLNNGFGPADIVHYVPEQGCTVRVIREGAPTLYGKCRTDKRPGIAASVHAVAGPHARAVRLATIVSHDAERGLLWQQDVAGLSADPADIIIRPRHWTARIAIALSDFHSLPAPLSLSRLTVASLSQTFARRAQATADAMPALAQRIMACHDAILGHELSERPLRLAHCDLHPANLLWDGERFALIDLDTAALAPALLDYATLTAALIHKAIELNVRDMAIGRMIDAMRLAAGREDDDPAAFALFTAACLIAERLYRCMTRRKSPRACTRERLLSIADSLVAAHA